jgi:hypothetical protein
MKIVSTVGDVDKVIKELSEYNRRLEEKTRLFGERLAALGATKASLEFARAITDNNDVEITVDRDGNNFIIRAEGQEVAFIEFGAGITYGYGHPQASEFGTGPGTFPNGKGHWNDPKGWWYIDKDGNRKHTYGTPPSMPMYNTMRELEQQIEQIAREVFR